MGEQNFIGSFLEEGGVLESWYLYDAIYQNKHKCTCLSVFIQVFSVILMISCCFPFSFLIPFRGPAVC